MESSDDLNKKLIETQLRHLEREVLKTELECRELSRHPFLRETFMLALGSLLLTMVTAVPSVFTAWTATRNTQNVLNQKEQVQRALNEEEQLTRQQDNSLGDLTKLLRENAELKKTMELIQQQATEESKLLYSQARETANLQLSKRPEGGKVTAIVLAAEEQRPRAEKLKALLEEGGIEVGDIKVREKAAPYTTEVRYFHQPDDLALADWVVQQLQDPKIGSIPKTRAAPFKNDAIPANQVEIHFSKEVAITGD